jgi:hypothetical protein
MAFRSSRGRLTFFARIQFPKLEIKGSLFAAFAVLAGNIAGVSTASAEAGAAAGEVLKASDALRRESDLLRAEIDAFLSNIRAA